MTLNECCALAQDMTRIPITVLQTPTDCMLFCTQYQFHPLQEYLLPRTMELFLEGLSENETVCVTDPFHIKTLFFSDRFSSSCAWPVLYRVLLLK